ncbi:MAG: metal-dependent hydrolase [Candidatus Velthaea sp.]
MLTRKIFLGALSAAGAVCAAPAFAAAPTQLKVRWYGGGVYELATPDDAAIVLVDAWIWNNTGFARFTIPKPAELASPAAYVAYLKARNPKSIVVALTHDHGDHSGDFFALLKALTDANMPVSVVGQGDLMRVGFLPRFKDAGLDETKLVVNGGNGINFGGTAAVGPVQLHLVPAVHSNGLPYPAAGYIIDIAGTRVYASGDTDVFGDMALIGKRYNPALAVVCAGGGPFTMDAGGAADAVRMTGATHAIPVHYGHNPLVAGPEAGERFRTALARVAPGVTATIMKPGERVTLALPPTG